MRLLLMCAVCAIVAGCDEKGTVLPIGELETKQGQLDAVRGQTGTLKLEKAILAYQAADANAAFPATLEDLVPLYLPAIPTKADGTAYRYDAATGKIAN